jgi:hypothetical protein
MNINKTSETDKNAIPKITKKCHKCDPNRNERLEALIKKMIWLLDNPRDKELFDAEIEVWYKQSKHILSEN